MSEEKLYTFENEEIAKLIGILAPTYWRKL